MPWAVVPLAMFKLMCPKLKTFPISTFFALFLDLCFQDIKTSWNNWKSFFFPALRMRRNSISNPDKTDGVFKPPSMHFATPSPAWCISTGRLNLFSSPVKVSLEIDYHRVIIDVTLTFKSFFSSKACRCLCVLKHTCVWPRLGYDKEEVLLACAGKKLVLIFPHSHWFSAQHTARRLYYDFRPNLQICTSLSS